MKRKEICLLLLRLSLFDLLIFFCSFNSSLSLSFILFYFCPNKVIKARAECIWIKVPWRLVLPGANERSPLPLVLVWLARAGPRNLIRGLSLSLSLLFSIHSSGNKCSSSSRGIRNERTNERGILWNGRMRRGGGLLFFLIFSVRGKMMERKRKKMGGSVCLVSLISFFSCYFLYYAVEWGRLLRHQGVGLMDVLLVSQQSTHPPEMLFTVYLFLFLKRHFLRLIFFFLS